MFAYIICPRVLYAMDCAGDLISEQKIAHITKYVSSLAYLGKPKAHVGPGNIACDSQMK